MADTPKKIFGIDMPASPSWTLLYHPALTAIISTICICNRGSATTVRLSHGVTITTPLVTEYVLFDTPIEANSSIFLTIGMCVSSGDYLYGYAGTTDVTFIAWGVETT